MESEPAHVVKEFGLECRPAEGFRARSALWAGIALSFMLKLAIALKGKPRELPRHFFLLYFIVHYVLFTRFFAHREVSPGKGFRANKLSLEQLVFLSFFLCSSLFFTFIDIVFFISHISLISLFSYAFDCSYYGTRKG